MHDSIHIINGSKKMNYQPQPDDVISCENTQVIISRNRSVLHKIKLKEVPIAKSYAELFRFIKMSLPET